MNEVLETVVESTPESIIVPDVVEIPEPVVVEIPEQVYTYQPMDESGRPLGGKQVVKYRTPDELATKLSEQNVLLVRKLREQTKKNRLGEITEGLPEDTARFMAPSTFTPRQLTAEERVQLSRDLIDPDKFEEASSTLFEATVGVKPEELRNTLSELQSTNIRILAKTESDAFMSSNPEYFKCVENFETIRDWMIKNDLAPLRQNFQLAFDRLKEDDLMIMAPEKVVPVEVPVTPAPVVEAVVEPVVPIVPAVARVVPPSGLTRNLTSDGAPVKVEKYTLADINRMSSEVYKQKLREPGFSELVNRLENEDAAKRKRK